MNDGEPAFPRSGTAEGYVSEQSGMSLRDWFAGNGPHLPDDTVLQIFKVAQRRKALVLDTLHVIAEAEAELRYLFADAMLAERGKESQK